MSAKVTRPSGNGQKMSEYERSVLENVKNIQSEYAEVFGNVKHSAEELAKSVRSSTVDRRQSIEKKSARKSQYSRQVKTQSKPSRVIKYIRRSARLRNEIKKPTDYNEQSDSDEDNENKSKNHSTSLRFKFPWFKSNDYKKRDEEYYILHGDSDFIDSDDDDDDKDLTFYKSGEPRLKRRRLVPTSRLPVSQVTQEMLKNITYKSSGKQHSANGTTCHQCRQKTLDQKSYCRYKECRGVRGMFCGFCLGKRYGEDVATVLLNPKWACPPCRGYCNCSICRRKQGRIPTGQLAPQASAGGYKSVRHMLSSMEGEATEKTGNKSEDDDDFINDENCIEDNDQDEQENEEDEQENVISEVIKTNDGGDIVIAKPLKTDGLNNMADNHKTESDMSDKEVETESSDDDFNNSDEYNSDKEMEDARDNIRFF